MDFTDYTGTVLKLLQKKEVIVQVAPAELAEISVDLDEIYIKAADNPEFLLIKRK